MDAYGVQNLGDRCSNVAAEGSAHKEAKGKAFQCIHGDVGPSHFAKVVMSDGLELLPIPEGFRQYISNVPKIIVPKTNTGYAWMIKVRKFDGKISMDKAG
jgi:hypothetical protein